MIKHNMSNADYHAHPARSKSYLWELYSHTPFHAQNMKIDPTPAMDLGTATHTAILEPEKFLSSVIKGPEDRRGNKWKDVYDEAAAYGKVALTAGDYEKCLYMRDAAHRLPIVRQLTDGKQIVEASAFWQDEESGVDCRCRPDLYHPEHAIMADLKTTNDASPAAFSKTVGNFGYHAQEAIYRDGWPLAGGGAVDGFIFIAVENVHPFAVAIYELVPSAVLEGRAIIRDALQQYKQCRETNVWPGYSTSIEPLDIQRWSYRKTFNQGEM